MRHIPRCLSLAVTTLTTVLITGCGGNGATPMPSPIPTPTVTASAYILPGAVSLNDWAFGDEPVVVYKNERLRWVNLDGDAHRIVADSPDATDFRNTDELRPGGEQAFDIGKVGTTRIHCAIHPNMTGTLIVRER
jgi:plastocyanin